MKHQATNLIDAQEETAGWCFSARTEVILSKTLGAFFITKLHPDEVAQSLAVESCFIGSFGGENAFFELTMENVHLCQFFYVSVIIFYLKAHYISAVGAMNCNLFLVKMATGKKIIK